MKTTIIGAALALLLATGAASAHDYTVGEIAIAHPWARETAPGMQNGAAYLELANHGSEADRLIAASSPAARKVELHTHTMDAGGVMKMRPVEGGIELPPGETVTLAPGGLHLMMMGLEHRLEADTRVALTLTFEKAGEVEVAVAVEAMRQQGTTEHGQHKQ